MELLSVIVPCYNEEEVLPETKEKLENIKKMYIDAINGMARVRVVLESVDVDSVIVGVAEA